MGFKLERIMGNTPLDIKKINDNLSNLWMKVFGSLEMSDMTKDVKNQMYTNMLQPQGEGNIDSYHPMRLRFYIPSDTHKIKTATLNCILSRYRIDSDTTSTTDSSAYGGGTAYSTGSTSGGSFDETLEVDQWGSASYPTGGGGHLDMRFPTPSDGWHSIEVPPDETVGAYSGMPVYVFDNGYLNPPTHACVVGWVYPGGTADMALFDIYAIQHTHKFSKSLAPHAHDFEVAITIPGHSHNMNMAIKEASVAPTGVTLRVNGTQVGSAMSGDGATQNDIDISSQLIIGGWNTIDVICGLNGFQEFQIGRATVYGICELIQQYT